VSSLPIRALVLDQICNCHVVKVAFKCHVYFSQYRDQISMIFLMATVVMCL
jgi:hypothetical protein